MYRSQLMEVVEDARSGVLQGRFTAFRLRQRLWKGRSSHSDDKGYVKRVRALQYDGVITREYRVDEARLTQYLMSSAVRPDPGSPRVD